MKLKDLDTTGPDGWIAVLGQLRKGFLRVPVPYARAVEAGGGTPRTLSTFGLPPGEEAPEGLPVEAGLDPFDPGPLDGATGLLLAGGGDVDPELYGRPRDPRTHNVSQRRDRFELTMLTAALERDIPIFAICRGMQLLNVCLGGTLDQHLLDNDGVLDHYRDRPIGEAAHGLHIKEGSLLERIVGGSRIDVNTHHHQGLDDIAPDLEQIAWAEDGVLEAVVHADRTWVLGVQWHPEAMVPMYEEQTALFEAFVSATRRHRGDRVDTLQEMRSA